MSIEIRALIQCLQKVLASLLRCLVTLVGGERTFESSRIWERGFSIVSAKRDSILVKTFALIQHLDEVQSQLQ